MVNDIYKGKEAPPKSSPEGENLKKLKINHANQKSPPEGGDLEGASASPCQYP